MYTLYSNNLYNRIHMPHNKYPINNNNNNDIIDHLDYYLYDTF